MINTEFLQISDGTGDAVKATIQAPGRIIGATSIIVDTLAKWSAKYIVTTGTVGVDGFITAASMTVMRAHTTGGVIIIDGFEPGYTDIGNTAGQVAIIKPVTAHTEKVVLALNTIDTDIQVRTSETEPSHIQTGGIWSIVSGFNGAMTALVGYQAGYRGTVAALASRAFTASKDTYVDVLRTTGITSVTMTLVYTEVLNGVAAPALAANSIRLAKVVTSGAAITSVSQTGLDSLRNPLYPQNINAQTITHLRAWCNAGIANPATGIVIPYDTVQYDTLNEWSTANKRFTATKPGLYRVVARMWWGSGGAGGTEYAELYARKNGAGNVMNSERVAGSGTTSQLMRPIISDNIYLEANDTLDFINNSSNGIRDLVASQINTYVTIDRIG